MGLAWCGENFTPASPPSPSHSTLFNLGRFLPLWVTHTASSTLPPPPLAPAPGLRLGVDPAPTPSRGRKGGPWRCQIPVMNPTFMPPSLPVENPPSAFRTSWSAEVGGAEYAGWRCPRRRPRPTPSSERRPEVPALSLGNLEKEPGTRDPPLTLSGPSTSCRAGGTSRPPSAAAKDGQQRPPPFPEPARVAAHTAEAKSTRALS